MTAAWSGVGAGRYQWTREGEHEGRGGWHIYTGGQNREGKLRVNHGLKCKEEALREFLTVLSLRLGLQEI